MGKHPAFRFLWRLGMGALLVFPIPQVEAREFKVAVVDLKRVMSEYRDFQQAQSEIQRYLQQWRAVQDSLKRAIEQARADLDRQRVMLSDEAKLEKEREIENMEREYEEYVRSVWGEDGLLERQTREVLDPLIQKIRETIREIAEQEGYDLVLDLSSDMVLYMKPEYDLTQAVIEELNRAYEAPVTVTGELPFLAILLFKEENDQARQRNLGTLLLQYFVSALKNSPKFRLVSQAQISQQMQVQNITQDFLNFDAARSVAEAVLSDYFIYGTVRKEGDQVHIQAGLYRTSDGKEIIKVEGETEDRETPLQIKAQELATTISARFGQ